MSLIPARRSSYGGLLRTLAIENGSIFCRFRYTFCALSSEDFKVSRLYEDSQEFLDNDPSSLIYPVKPRLSWNARLNTSTLEKQPMRTRIPFSSHKYAVERDARYFQVLLNGLWSLDQDPVWLLVDDLVTTGEPQSSPNAFADFQRWKHIAMASNFSEATMTLVAQGYLRYRSPLDEHDEGLEEYGVMVENEGVEDAQEVPANTQVPIPTWLVAFMLVTMTNTRVEAYEGFAFCLSQLDATPRHLRASLLLLSMCSLSIHKVVVQVPVLMGAFHDVFSPPNSELGGTTEHSQSYGSRESMIYQYNALLTLLSQFPHVPGFARRTTQFLHDMESHGVRLDVDTGSKLVTSRFASNLLASTVRDILGRQGIHEAQEESDELSFALMRFYSKRSNQAEAAKYVEAARRARPGKYAQSYLRSFRDATASIAHLLTIEEVEPQEDTTHEGGKRLDHSTSVQTQTASSSPTADFRGITKRNIYTSLLHSASISKTISAETFRDLFFTIREAYGDDRELETLALSGLLKRKAWDQAKDLWYQWQTTNRSIRSILREMRSFLDKRERTFRDAGKVRRTLGWSKLTEQVTSRRMNMLSVDASALSVIVRALAGPKPDSLAGAFATMDEYALKMHHSGPQPTDLNSSNDTPSDVATGTEPVVEQVQLTSRVINCFMVRAMYFRRPDVVFRLWDGMTSHYGVDSSITTLDILIRSARLAASMETALTKFTPKWMVFSGGFFRRKPMLPNLSAEILWMLSPECSPSPRWAGIPAWRMVRRLFREEILFANWPWLRNVTVPALAIRGDDATGQVEAIKELAMDGGLWGTQVRKMGNYPHLIPSARIFREYIVMLGRVLRSSEIPETLAWMKALGILPSRRTLSLSLALWSQVGLESLADDVWGGSAYQHLSRVNNRPSSPVHPRHGGEYDKLLAWLEDWVGEDNVPGDNEVLDAFEYIQKLEEREKDLY